MIIQVISSITSSSFHHFKNDSLTSTFAADSGVPLISSFDTSLATSSLLKNSQTPSDAITINESSGFTLNW